MKSVKRLPQVDGELGWYLTAPNVDRKIGKALKGEQMADIAIIGAGFTGLAAAERLQELYPDKRIAVVEALDVGQGTSGRNAGFIIDLPHNVDAKENSEAEDFQLYALNQFAIARLFERVQKYSINCLWHQAGKYMVAREGKNVVGLDAFEHTLKKRHFAYQRLKRGDLAQKLGTEYYQEGIFTSGNVLMNPAALVRGLALGLQKHLDVYTHSPVIGIEYGDVHQIHTVGGMLRAKTIVQTMSSFSEETGLVKNKIAPVFTYGSLTDPLPDDLLQKHFQGIEPWGLTSAHPAGTTVRFTPDKRILVRNILEFNSRQASTAEVRNQAWQQHRKSFVARFPFLEHVDFQYTWGGLLAVTMNHNSVFEKLADNVYGICGCNGVGVAKGTYLGYYMAEMMHGNQSKELAFIQATSHANRIPPEPFRSVGARYQINREQSAAGMDI